MQRKVYRKFLLTALLTSALATPALAQVKAPEIYFYPAKSWSMGKIDDLCVIQNEFNNGFVVAFAGKGGVEALNLNLRQGVFEANKSYSTTLTIPGQAVVKTNAKAVSAEEITIGLINQYETYKKIRDAGVFDINIEGNDFRFYLTAYPTVADDFENCLGIGKKKSTVVSSIPVPPNAKPVAPSTDAPLVASSRDLGEAALAVMPARNETMALEDQLKYSTDSAKHRERMSDKLSKQILENPELVAMDDTNPAARKVAPSDQPATDPKVTGTPTNDDTMPPMPPAEVVNSEPLAPLPDLEKRKKVAVVKTEETTDTLKSAAVQTEETFKPKKEPLAPIPKAKILNTKTPDVQVNRQVMKTEADFTDIPPPTDKSGFAAPRAGDNQALLAMVSQLKNKVDMLRKENKALNLDLQDNLQASQQERMSIASENWNLERATMQFNEAELQIARLGKQLQSERAKCSVEKKELESLLFDPKVTEEAQLARLAELEIQLSEARTEIERLKRAN